MKLVMMILTAVVSMGTANSLTYPVFGTKRYHRGSASPRTGMTQHILRQPSYEDGYLTNNGYYYYPHHEYHSYGMPTYRGEYKPKAYYYSSGPSYNYYNDREPVSNPLDDLHEEILHENEQERQTDGLGDDEYDDEYYMEPNEDSHDTYTNNFLRNMMEYNRQKEKHQLLKQLPPLQREPLKDVTAREEEQPMDDDYFSEIGVNPDDYQYEPKGEDSFDLQKYWDAERSSASLSNSGTKSAVHHQRETLNGVNNVNTDEDVQALKSLTKQQLSTDDEDYNKRYREKTQQTQPIQFNSWEPKQTSESSKPQPKDHDDDYSGIDYDDGSWINWDRKRSSLPANIQAFNNENIISQFINRNRMLNALKEKQKKSPFNTVVRSTVVSTKSPEGTVRTIGQKEQFSTNGTSRKSDATTILKNENTYNGNSMDSKSMNGIDQSIYDTIKQMIAIQQELKKTGTNKRKRYIPDEKSLVSQLDSLRKLKN